MKITAATVGAAIAYVATVEPEVYAVYLAIKAIWLAANPPTATEADFVSSLIAASSSATSDADAILTGLGFVRDPTTGAWAKPAAS